jgi:uncharacterized Zn finger protein
MSDYAYWLRYENPNAACMCPHCQDDECEWIDTDEPDANVFRCPTCGYCDVWLESDEPLEIIIPKYEA